ncbi:MAG TPA: UDP-N-acetylglucosamine 2-epimerase (non-hydrolyzing), partial [Pirellulales bacterium]|nr:UDP-N-acetylglucosamine 2-epimerase (non-hydrolyzing) [Pirellulales bacterium]
MQPLRVLLAFGTRPEAIKLAPLIHHCRQHDEIEPIVCLTGQHREMLDQVIEYFGIEADVDLALMRPGQSLAELAARCLTGLDQTLARFRPDCVVAQGDTTTVAAAALAAFYRNVPFVHVEAGLRTGDLHAPWPEEMNRRLASLTAAIHCAPTEHARKNLLAERVPHDAVHVTGNTVIDALLWTARRERDRGDHWRQKYAVLGEQPLVLVTAHRRESFGHGLDDVCRAILILAAEYPDIEFVFPVHPNPQARESVDRILGKHGDGNIHLLDPLPY